MYVAIFGFPETDKVNKCLLLVQGARVPIGISLKGTSVERSNVYNLVKEGEYPRGRSLAGSSCQRTLSQFP